MKIEYSWQSTPCLWHAFDAETADGAEDSGELARMVGAGHTKEDALEDLIEQLDDYWRRECDKAEAKVLGLCTQDACLLEARCKELNGEVERLRLCISKGAYDLKVQTAKAEAYEENARQYERLAPYAVKLEAVRDAALNVRRHIGYDERNPIPKLLIAEDGHQAAARAISGLWRALHALYSDETPQMRDTPEPVVGTDPATGQTTIRAQAEGLPARRFCCCIPGICAVEPDTHCRINGAYNPPVGDVLAVSASKPKYGDRDWCAWEQGRCPTPDKCRADNCCYQTWPDGKLKG